MWTCPVCTSHDRKDSICQRCGYDESIDLIRFRTVYQAGEAEKEQIKKIYQAGKGSMDEKEVNELRQQIADLYEKIDDIYKKIGKNEDALTAVSNLTTQNRGERSESAAAHIKNERQNAERKVYRIGMLQAETSSLDDVTQGFIDGMNDHVSNELPSNVQLKFVYDEFKPYDSCDVTDGFKDMDMLFYNEEESPYLLSAVKKKYTAIPIIAAGVPEPADVLDVNEYDENPAMYKNVTGTIALADPKVLADVLMEVFPDRQTRIGMLYFYEKGNSSMWYQCKRFREHLMSDGYKHCIDNKLMAVMGKKEDIIRNLAKESDVLYLPYGNEWDMGNNNKLANMIKYCGKPVITANETLCGQCGTLTVAATPYFSGYDAGAMAVDILAGAKVADTALRFADDCDASCQKKYNAARCEQYGIKVPKDYEPVQEPVRIRWDEMVKRIDN